MVITIYTNEVLNSVKLTSHDECETTISDADLRYKVEAGTNRHEELYRAMNEGFFRLKSRIARWINGIHVVDADNVRHVPESVEYEFTMGERRSMNRSEVIAEAMHRFLVEYTLTKYYALVNQGELSNKHSLLAIDAGNELDTILYTKQPPRV